MENNNEEAGLMTILQNSGIDILDLPEHVRKLQQIFPTLKEMLPKLKEMEKGFKIKDPKGTDKKLLSLLLVPGEIVMYNVMITEHEIFLYISAAREVVIEGKKETLIRVMHKVELIKEAEKAMSNLPKI